MAPCTQDLSHLPTTIFFGEEWSTFPWYKRLGYEARWYIWLKWWTAIEDGAEWLYWKWHDWIHRDCKR